MLSIDSILSTKVLFIGSTFVCFYVYAPNTQQSGANDFYSFIFKDWLIIGIIYSLVVFTFCRLH